MNKQNSSRVLKARIEYFKPGGPFDPNKNKALIIFNRKIISNRFVSVSSKIYEDGSYQIDTYCHTRQSDVDLIERIKKIDSIEWIHISNPREIAITKAGIKKDFG